MTPATDDPVSFDLQAAADATDDERRRVADAMGRALEARGYLLLERHGVPADAFEGAYAEAGRFFDLPIEVKRRAADPRAHGLTGYSFGEPREAYGGGAVPPDMWHVGRDLLPRTEACPGNPWPEADAPGFRPAMERLRDALDGCAARLFPLLSLYLHGDETSVPEATLPRGMSMLRVMRYPAHDGAVVDGADRSEPHADTCLVTLATGGTGPGLELAAPGGGYVAVEPGHRRLVVLAGRMLELLTNGVVRGLKHRAAWYAAEPAPRLASPYFVCPVEGHVLRPLPRFVERVGADLYHPFTAIEFVRAVTSFGDASYRDQHGGGASSGSASDPVSIGFARRAAG